MRQSLHSLLLYVFTLLILGSHYSLASAENKGLSRQELRRLRALNPDFQPTLQHRSGSKVLPTAGDQARAQYRTRVAKGHSRVDTAHFSEVTVRKISSDRAHLRGRIQAHGLYKLYLQFIGDNEVKSIRYIGELELSAAEGPILFSFTSPLPVELDFSQLKWRLEARPG